MRTINREIVAAIIVSADGKTFHGMKHPDRGGVYLNCWHIPGGGVEKGESKKEALAREIREETGIDISTCKITLIDDLGRGESEKTLENSGEKVLCKMKFDVYRVEIDRPAKDIEVVPGSDLEKHVWLGATELKNLKLTPPSQELFKRLGYLD